MKISSLVLFLTLLLAACAYADPGVIIRERAKELRDQNNVRQGVAPPTQPAQPVATPNAPAGPTLSPAILRFNTEIAAIRADEQVTLDQKQKLAQELVVAAQGAK